MVVNPMFIPDQQLLLMKMALQWLWMCSRWAVTHCCLGAKDAPVSSGASCVLVRPRLFGATTFENWWLLMWHLQWAKLKCELGEIFVQPFEVHHLAETINKLDSFFLFLSFSSLCYWPVGKSYRYSFRTLVATERSIAFNFPCHSSNNAFSPA